MRIFKKTDVIFLICYLVTSAVVQGGALMQLCTDAKIPYPVSCTVFVNQSGDRTDLGFSTWDPTGFVFTSN